MGNKKEKKEKNRYFRSVQNLQLLDELKRSFIRRLFL